MAAVALCTLWNSYYSSVISQNPLRDVSDTISEQLLEGVIRILHRDMCLHFGITHPHILVCGLNPHAGENGHLGREEHPQILQYIHKFYSNLCSQNSPSNLGAFTITHGG